MAVFDVVRGGGKAFRYALGNGEAVSGDTAAPLEGPSQSAPTPTAAR